MDSSSDNRNPVELLAEEFMARKCRGEKPTLSEYAAKYPDLADDIRDLFPALVVMEDLADSSLAATGPHEVKGVAPLNQLGDYRILREVSRGGMGVVYEAEQESLGRRVALKVLPPHVLNDSQQVRRFEREARAAARLHHTNIVPVFGVGSDQGMHYYVMQFIQGLGLDEVLEELKRLRKASPASPASPASRGRQPPEERPDNLPGADAPGSQGNISEIARSLATGAFALTAPVLQPGSPDSSSTRLPGGSALSSVSESDANYWRSVARIGVQVAEALDYAHSQGILHRDIKPSNLLLDMRGTVWVTDFGLAKAASPAAASPEREPGEGDITHTGDIVGTIRYMAPERFSGQSDARADVYALGLTLYELLALKPAYTEHDRAKLMQQVLHNEPPPLRRVNPAIPRDLETIVHKAMTREPERRYQTPHALAEDLQRFIEDRPIQARRTSTRERFWRWCRRNPVVACLSAALALVFLTGFGGVAWKWREAERQKDIAQSAEVGEAAQRKIALQKAECASREVDRSRRLVYAADMSLAQQAWDAGDTGRAHDILERQWPEDGREDLRGFEWRYLWGHCRDGSRQTLPGHKYEVTSLAFSADSSTLVTSGWSNPGVRIWDLAAQRHIQLQLFLNTSVALAPDGKTLAIIGLFGRAVRLWDVSARCEWPSLSHPSCVRGMAFSPHGKLLATGCEDGTIRIWDVATWREIDTPLGHSAPVVQVIFSPDEKILASGSRDSTVRLWDVAARRAISTLQGHVGGVNSLSFAPDGKTIASAGTDGTVRLWDTVTGRQMKMLRGQRTALRGVAFSPEGKRLATGGGDGTVRVWDAATLELTAMLRGHTAPVTVVAFAPDGKSLVSGSLDWTVKVWDFPAKPDPSILTGHKLNPSSVAFSPDGKTLAVGDVHDYTVKLWDIASRQQVGILEGQKTPVSRVVFAPGGQTLASTGSFDGKILVWGIAGRKRVTELQHSGVDANSFVASAAFSPNGKLLAAGAQGTAIGIVWHIASGQRVKELIPASFVEFSPDGTLLAAGAYNGVRLWDVATWQHIATLSESKVECTCLAFTPDGKILATGAADGTLQLWDVESKREAARRRAHTSNVESVAFSPDGRRLASSGADNTVKLWDVAQLQDETTLMEVAALTGHTGPVLSVAFSPDGNLLASASADGAVRLWEAPPLLSAVREPPKPATVPPVETYRLFWLAVWDPAQLTLTSEGNVHRVDVTAVNAAEPGGHISSLVQLFEDIQEGATYTVRFRAKADPPRRTYLDAQIEEPDWHSIGLHEEVALTEDWRPFQYEFQAKDSSALGNRIVFWMGDHKGAVWISDFAVTKQSK
jgi:WD40 repeat protein/serine/threonine protein kinase